MLGTKPEVDHSNRGDLVIGAFVGSAVVQEFRDSILLVFLVFLFLFIPSIFYWFYESSPKNVIT